VLHSFATRRSSDLLLAVGVDRDHQPVELVHAAEQEVVNSVERVHAPVGCDCCDVATRVLGPDGVVEQDDARPVVARAEDRAVAAHRVAAVRVAERGGQVVASERECPRGQGGVEVRQAEGARVHVEGDVLAPLARGVDELDAATALREAVARHEMGDLEAHLGAVARADRLGDRLRRAGGAAARWGGLERRVTGERGHLVLRGRLLLRILESGRVAPGALVERLAQEGLHLPDLPGIRGAVGETERRQPKLAVRDEAQHVDGGLGGVESREVLAGRAPGQREALRVAVDRAARGVGVADREAAEAAVADDLRRHALVDRAHRAGIDEQRVVGVAVQVDESRADREPGGVDLLGVDLVDVADDGDASVVHEHVARTAGCAGAVVDRAAADRDPPRPPTSRFTYAPSRRKRSLARPTASSSISKPCPGASGSRYLPVGVATSTPVVSRSARSWCITWLPEVRFGIVAATCACARKLISLWTKPWRFTSTPRASQSAAWRRKGRSPPASGGPCTTTSAASTASTRSSWGVV